MFNFNLKATIQALSQRANSQEAPGSPNINKPDTKSLNPNANPAADTPNQTKGMVNQQRAGTDGLKAKQDNTPLEYSNQEVELSATAIPEKEAPKVAEKKGFKANLMDQVGEQFKGGSQIERANSQNGKNGPDTGIQSDPSSNKRPQPPGILTPPSKNPPNPKLNPSLPPDISIPQPKVPSGNFPKVNIPKFRSPKL